MRSAFPQSVFWVLIVGAVGGLLSLAVAGLDVPLAAGAVLVLGFLLVFLAQPALGLLTVLLVRASSDLTFEFMGIAGGGGRLGALPNVMLILILTLAGGLYILARGVPLIGLPGGRLLTLLLLTGLVGVVRSDSTILAMNEWIPVLASFATYALAAYLFHDPSRVQRVADVIAASAILPVAMGLGQLITGRGVVRPDFPIPAVVGTFLHPNTFGFYLVMVVAVFLGQAACWMGRRKTVALVALGLALALLVATYARVAWAGALVVLLVVGVLRQRVILFLLPIGGLFTFLLLPSIGARIADALIGGGSLGDRLYNLWPRTMQAWLSATAAEGGGFILVLNRVAGLGPGAGSLALSRFGLAAIPHNDYLRVLVEYGILGLLLYFAVSVVLAVVAYRTWREAKDGNPGVAAMALSFLALAVAFPIMSVTDNIFAHTVNQVYFWTLAGLMVAIRKWDAEVSEERFRQPKEPSLERDDGLFPRRSHSPVS